MIDDPSKTHLLMGMLKESLPIQTMITPYLASALAKQSPDMPIPAQCSVIDVFYTGDMGGILCCLVGRLPVLANDLVRAQVSVICAGGPPAALAAKAATTTIPIVFTSGEDPVKIGLVASYNRPGGNVTGVAVLIEMLGAKRLGLLRELVPAATLIAVLLNPTEPTFDTQLNDMQEAARAVGQKIHVLHASTEHEIDAAFARAKELQAGAMLVGISFFYTIRREQIVALAARAALPTIYGQREFMSAGGLMSYATNLADAYRQAGVYAGKILGGIRPADLPVVQSIMFELMLNLKTAKVLGLTFPSGLLALADEVIE